MCVRAKKNKRDFSLTVRHTQELCNWFDNSEIIQNLSCGFSLQRERVFHVNICVLVCNCYFGLLIFSIILFEDNWWNLSQCRDCWEIASNTNCDLKSQLGFPVEEGKINLGFLIVEGKTIPWCERKFISC